MPRFFVKSLEQKLNLGQENLSKLVTLVLLIYLAPSSINILTVIKLNVFGPSFHLFICSSSRSDGKGKATNQKSFRREMS